MPDARDPIKPPATLPTGAAGKQATKRPPRVAGPFEARSLGALELPLRVHDLSIGGCLIESYHDVAMGRRIQLEIDMPGEGWVALQGETVYLRENFGFGVKFVDVDAETRVKLARAVVQVLRERKKPR
jgi:PilZ domain